MAQSQYKQDETDAVSEKASHGTEPDRRERGHRSTSRISDREAYRPRDQPLDHCYLNRVSERHFARKIVVESPREARAHDSRRADQVVEGRTGMPVQDEGSGNDAEHSHRDTAVEVLVEYEPSKQGGQHAFESQQKRSRRCLNANKARQQKNGTKHATGKNRCGEPRKFTTGQLRLSQAFDATNHHMHAKQADTRPAVENASEHPRVRRLQKYFRNRRREAEQESRNYRQSDGRIVHSNHQPNSRASMLAAADWSPSPRPLRWGRRAPAPLTRRTDGQTCRLPLGEAVLHPLDVIALGPQRGDGLE